MKKITDKEVTGLPVSIKHKTNLLYLLSRCCDLMLWTIQKDLRKVSRTYDVSGDVKMRFNQFSSKIDQAQKHFENFLEPQIISSGAGDNFRDYERSRQFANELMRLVMTYYETCCSNQENHEKVFDTLCSLTGGLGVFTAEDINEFDLGCKNNGEEV